MHFLKSVEDYEPYKKTNINFYIGPLKNELEIFQKLYDEFNNINVPILNLNDFQEYLKDDTFDCISTISEGKIIVCDNDTGNKWTEEFEIDDYQFAADWCLGKIEYQEYLDYLQTKSNNYIISIWETDEDRALGESFDYPQSYINIDEAIKTAKSLIKLNNYSCIEVLDSKDKCFYWSDGKDEEYFNNLNDYKNILDKCREYKDFDLEKFNFYYTISNIEPDLSENDALRLMNICERCSSDYIQSSSLAFDLTNAVYVNHYISLDELEKIPSDDIREMYNDNKLFLLENYKSKETEK